MLQKHVIYPEKIYLLDYTRISDGTVTTIKGLKEDASAYLVPRRGEEGVTLNITEEGVDIRERGEDGAMIHKDVLRTSFGMSFSINIARWNLELEALMRGDDADAVKTNHKASIVAKNDATVTGIELLEGIGLKKFTALFQMPADPETDDVLYIYVPKCTRLVADRDMTLNVAQVNTVLAMRALALEDTELTEHQSIYSKVTASGLYFPFEGQVDGDG